MSTPSCCVGSYAVVAARRAGRPQRDHTSRWVPDQCWLLAEVYEMAQLPPLKLLLHSDWTAKLPPFMLTIADAPWPLDIQAHLSPFSAPPESTQPLLGVGSVTVSA